MHVGQPSSTRWQVSGPPVQSTAALSKPRAWGAAACSLCTTQSRQQFQSHFSQRRPGRSGLWNMTKETSPPMMFWSRWVGTPAVDYVPLRKMVTFVFHFLHFNINCLTVCRYPPGGEIIGSIKKFEKKQTNCSSVFGFESDRRGPHEETHSKIITSEK